MPYFKRTLYVTKTGVSMIVSMICKPHSLDCVESSGILRNPQRSQRIPAWARFNNRGLKVFLAIKKEGACNFFH